MKEQLLQRIQELRIALEQSANNHNALIGRMAEAQFMYEKYMQSQQSCAEIPPEIAAILPPVTD
jgi:hypothetical protein